MPDNERENRGKVTSGNVRKTKNTGIRRFANQFLAEDLGSIWDYTINEIIFPSIGDWIQDIVAMIFPGSSGRKSRRYSSDREDYVSYSKDKGSSRSKYADAKARETSKYKTGADVMGVVFETRMDADRVLDELNYYGRKYHNATVAQFYGAAGITSDNYMNNKFGWSYNDIRNAYVSRMHGGFIIVIAPAVQLDD